MAKLLFSWLGRNDLNSIGVARESDMGPLFKGLKHDDFDRAYVLYNYPEDEVRPYVEWLPTQTTIPVEFIAAPLKSPVDHHDIYKAFVRVLEANADRKKDSLTFHLSPGTPSMHSVLLLLGKTVWPARLLQSSREAGVVEASVPFDVSIEYLPDLLRSTGRALEAQAVRPTNITAFKQLTYRSRVMKQAVDLGERVAPFDMPVLITGESGTGKEVFANAIHAASTRSDGPMIRVNCGAIPQDLIESELFGHVKGSFSGAVADRLGHFREAHGGTIFLDEVGELPLAAQVKLLRVLQVRRVVPVGGSKEVDVDVRVLSATHRDLPTAVSRGQFREDLFYRLAVAVIELPAVRDRAGDLGLLIDALLDEVNKEHEERLPGFFKPKPLTAGARNRLLQHRWPGNVRELRNTLLGAAALARGDKIGKDDIRLFPATRAEDDDFGKRPLGDGFNLDELLKELERSYIERALAEAAGNKSAAARLLGKPTYQALDYRLKALGISIQKKS